jgi:exonuclease SbcC
VLQRLFGTEHYLAVEQVLVGLRRDAETAVGGAELAVRDALVALLEAADVPAADTCGAETPTDEVGALLALDRPARGDQLDVLELQVAERVDAAGAALTEAQTAHERLRAAVEDGRRAVQLVLRRRAALEAHTELGTASASVERAREIVAAATRAGDLAPVLAEVERARDEHVAALAALDLLEPGGRADALHELDADALLRRAHELRRAADLLEPAVELERAVAERIGALQALRADREGCAAELAEAGRRIETLPVERDALRAELAIHEREAARLGDLTEAERVATQRCDAWDALPSARAHLLAADDAVRVATDEAQVARAACLDARERRIEGMAAELASRLGAGDPCPVCGGLEHPAPAQGSLEHPTAEDVAALDAVAARAEAVRSDAEADRQTARAHLAALEAEAGPQDPRPAREALLAELDRAVRSAAELARCRRAVAAAEDELARLRSRVDALRARDAVLAEQLASAEAAVARDETVIGDARGDAVSVLARREALVAQESVLRERAAATRAVEQAAQRLDSLERAALAAAQGAGFADLGSLRSAVLAPEDLARVQALVDEHDAAAAAVARELADPGVATAGDQAPDLAEAEAALAAADARLDAARRAAGVAADRLAAVRARRASLEQVEDATTQIREGVRPTIRVADAVTGRPSVNPRRMTLSTYVLRERFEAVVTAASRRLQQMSDGRYLLVSDESGTGNRRAGLGLAVADQWTGQQRDTATLSGGESFYASLALALGLADTVRDEVGGVELETLFIDEGFGSLDADALEQVLDVIDGLRDGGRVVGIVSHVTELKERISDRIEVRRLTDGSSALAVRS